MTPRHDLRQSRKRILAGATVPPRGETKSRGALPSWVRIDLGQIDWLVAIAKTNQRNCTGDGLHP